MSTSVKLLLIAATALSLPLSALAQGTQQVPVLNVTNQQPAAGEAQTAPAPAPAQGAAEAMATPSNFEPPPPGKETIWQAEEWAQTRNSPWITPMDADDEKKNHKGPVRKFLKAVAKGTAKELGTSAEDFAKDMVLVFSVQDIDPYEQKGPPKNRAAIVLKFEMIDGKSCYLRRFPDGSYAIEDGFADGTVLIPRRQTNDYLVKYPNGFFGRMVRTNQAFTIYRPDKTTTTIEKTASGGYVMRNSKLGYMGEARPDDTGVHYEVGEW